MNRSLPLIHLFTFFSFILIAQEKTLNADTKISQVIVFLHGAQIERSGQVVIPAGSSTVLFKDLSPEIDEQSIQVKGTGDFTILSVNRQNNFLNEQKANEEVQKLRDQTADLRDAKEIQENAILILKKEEEMLASNQSIGNGGAGLDLNKLKQALDFQRERLTENKVKQLNVQKTLRKLDEQISKLEKQANEAGKSKTNTSDIAVKVSAKRPGSASFSISYLVKNATWYPSYDLRATDVTRPVEMIYRANISQQSGEEWKNVRLILSSGDPSRGGAKPSLRPYQIGYNILRSASSANISTVYGKITDAADGSALPGASIRVKGTSIGTTSGASGDYSIQVPSPDAMLSYSYIGYVAQERPVTSALSNVQLRADASQLNEVVVQGYGTQKKLEGKVAGIQIRGSSSLSAAMAPEVQTQENQTTVQFEVAQPYSISSDGKLLTVGIAEHKLDADFRYYAVPKVSQDAYLSASITGIADLNLLSGEATIFFEGAYLGKTLINMDNTNDTLHISLGADKNVIVKRVQQKEKNEKSLIGSATRAVRAFSFDILNRKNQPLKLTIEDQIPVSTSSEVSVESQELSGAKPDDVTGMLKWEMELQPGEKKSLLMRYQVKYPKNRPVSLE